MPADHTYFQDCVKELMLVFREANDSDEKRNDYTPDPLVIAHNLQVRNIYIYFYRKKKNFGG